MPVTLPETEITPEPAQFIRIDLFPANAKYFAPTEQEDEEPQETMFYDARVIVTDGHGYVFSDTKQGPRATLIGDLTGFSGSNRDGYTATFDDGSHMFFKRSTGCGCGSRLRGIRPFPSTPHAPLSIF